MPCPHCASPTTAERAQRITPGYRTYRCHACRRSFNERTGTPSTTSSTRPISSCSWCSGGCVSKLSLRDLAEMFLERGFVFTHETVRDWEARFAPLLAEHLRAKRRGQAGRSWYVDETYVKVNGTWCYLYRAIDREGNLVDARLSETRDMDGAQQFFRQAVATVGQRLDRVTTDGHDVYPRAIWETLGDDVAHRCSRYLNNRTGTGPSGHQAALLPHARVWAYRLCRPVLPPTRNSASTSGHARRWASRSRSRSDAACFAIDGRPCWVRSWPHNRRPSAGRDMLRAPS